MGAVLLVCAAVGGAFLIDRSRHADRVARNVILDGVQIGGMELERFERDLTSRAAEYGGQPLTIMLGDERIESTATEYGFVLDAPTTIDMVEAVGRGGSSIDQFFDWLGRLRDPVVLETQFISSPDVARAALVEDASTLTEAPVEPIIGFDGSELTVDVGAPGRRVDIDATAAALEATTSLSSIEGAWEPIPQLVAPGDAIATVTRLKARIESGIVLHTDGAQSFVSPELASSWIAAVVEDGALETTFDERAIRVEVDEAFFGFVTGELEVTYEVIDGVPMVATVSDTRRVCCDPSVVQRIVDVLTGDAEPRVELPLRAATPDEQAAAVRDLGVVEEVSSFTTFHNCCESRVTNIHRIADLIQGVVLMPGESFSINDFVGERTRENGFVPGGVIYQGEFESDIGGGISQYATTLFNAAFFAGLEFPQYQSHSLYLSRYPYGREATVSYPEPDLVILNQTPYAVLLWSRYDARSITVSMYSTPSVVVTQTGQDIDRSSACTRVTTHRLRTFSDGTEIEDAVYAFYRPTAGYSCGDLEVDEEAP